MTLKAADGLNLLILAALVTLSLLAFDRLPDEIPLQFGADGRPDRFGARSLIGWMALPLIAVALTALMYGVGRLLTRMPNQLNVPDAKAYRELPLEDKLVVIEQQRDLLGGITVGMNVMLAALQAGAYQVALGAERLPVYSWLVIAGFVVFSMAMAVRAVVNSGKLIGRLSAHRRKEDTVG